LTVQPEAQGRVGAQLAPRPRFEALSCSPGDLQERVAVVAERGGDLLGYGRREAARRGRALAHFAARLGPGRQERERIAGALPSRVWSALRSARWGPRAGVGRRTAEDGQEAEEGTDERGRVELER